MNDRLQISAYWRARQESAEMCAARAVRFFEELRAVAPLFSTWYLKSRSRKNARSQPIALEHGRLTELFSAGVNRRDVDKSVIADLGFNLGVWTGDADGVSASLRVTCGSYSTHLDNVCLLDVVDGHDLDADVVLRITDAAVRAWDPDGVDVNAKTVYSRPARQK